jgi:two-component system response regulator PilR (NtrC family)
VPLLASHFLKKYAPAAGKSIVRIASDSVAALVEYQWPGNVRQLENTIERAVALECSNELRVEVPAVKSRSAAENGNGNGHANGNGTGHANGNGHSGLPTMPQFIPVEGVDLERYIASMERAFIQSALKQSNGVQTRAAEMLKLSYRSFRHLLKKYDI